MDTTNLTIDLYDLKETDKREKTTSANTPRDYIFIKNCEYFKRIKYQEIFYLEASGSYCILHLSNSEKITCTHTLSELVRYLSPSVFIRIHRSFVINLDYVSQYLGNQLWIGKESIPIGRLYKKEVLNHLNIVGGDITLS